MIDDPPILTLNRDFDRPTADQVNQFAGVSTGVVVDCLGGRGGIAIKSVNPEAVAFCGVAVTCDTGPADNLAVFGALDISGPGDVIVIATDAFEATAVVGDMVLGMAKNRGVVAMATDGYVRDKQGLCAVGLPCFAAGITPNSPARNGPGSAGLPIVIANVAISSGDIIVGDHDGIVVVPFARISEALQALPLVLKAEAALDKEVAQGLAIPDFVEGLLRSDRVKNV